MGKARFHTSPILEDFFKPYSKMKMREKIKYLETENQMLKQALDASDNKKNSNIMRSPCGCCIGANEKGFIEMCDKCVRHLG